MDSHGEIRQLVRKTSGFKRMRRCYRFGTALPIELLDGTVSLRAKAYITLTATIGVLILQHASAALHSEDGIRLLCYLTGAVLTSQLKVRLPGITGTMSVNFFFIMLGILE